MNKQISFQEIKNPVRTYIKDSLSHEPIYSLIAIEFLKDLNITLYRDFPAIQTIAEEASDL